jgi:DNA mismatch endonuclease, patch repair protein
MTDIVDIATRRRMMAGIRARDTRPEKLIRRLLHSQGFRFRLNAETLPGKPDILLPRYHAAVFVHGCFWHGHACRLFKWPATRTEFWRAKIESNRKNDKKVCKALLALGWRVAIIRECAIRGAGRDIEAVSLTLGEWLRGADQFIDITDDVYRGTRPRSSAGRSHVKTSGSMYAPRR